MASLSHPHIAAVYGVAEADGNTVLVLELVEGESLAERLRRGPLPVDEALRLAAQIADALEAAHQHGVVHRDLKPANVQVTGAGTAKLLDFGLAKALQSTAEDESSIAPTRTLSGTRPGTVLGTPAYMSPDQARGEPADERTDVGAFGVVLYEMLTGRSLFDRGTYAETVASILGSSSRTRASRPHSAHATTTSLRATDGS